MTDPKDPPIKPAEALPLGAHITLARPVRLWLSARSLRPLKLPVGLPGQIVSLTPRPLIAGSKPPRVVEVDFGARGRYWLHPDILAPVLAD